MLMAGSASFAFLARLATMIRSFLVALGRACLNGARALIQASATSLVVLAILIVDGALVLALMDGDLTVWLALAVHVCVVLLTGALLFSRTKRPDEAFLVTLWALLLGPFGAIGALITVVRVLTQPGDREADEEWFLRLSGFQESEDDLVVALRDQRAYEATDVRLQSFRQVMEQGSVSDKQTILGFIAHAYEPAFASLLFEALRSPQVAVRASAAAVLARLRDLQRTEMLRAEELATRQDHESLSTAIDILLAAATSGLLSAEDSAMVQQRARVLRRRFASLDVVPLTLRQLDERLTARAARSRHSGRPPLRRPVPFMVTAQERS